MAITAWSAKVWSSSMCFCGERTHLHTGHGDPTDGSAVAQQGHGEDRPVRHRPRHAHGAILRVGLDVRNLGKGQVLDGAADRGLATRRQRKVSFVRDRALGAQPVVGHEVDAFAVELENRAELAVAQLHRALRDHVEHRLRVGWGTRNHPQDLADRRVLLQCLRQTGFDLANRVLAAVAHHSGCLEWKSGERRTTLQPCPEGVKPRWAVARCPRAALRPRRRGGITSSPACATRRASDHPWQRTPPFNGIRLIVIAFCS